MADGRPHLSGKKAKPDPLRDELVKVRTRGLGTDAPLPLLSALAYAFSPELASRSEALRKLLAAAAARLPEGSKDRRAIEVYWGIYETDGWSSAERRTAAAEIFGQSDSAFERHRGHKHLVGELLDKIRAIEAELNSAPSTQVEPEVVDETFAVLDEPPAATADTAPSDRRHSVIASVVVGVVLMAVLAIGVLRSELWVDAPPRSVVQQIDELRSSLAKDWEEMSFATYDLRPGIVSYVFALDSKKGPSLTGHYQVRVYEVRDERLKQVLAFDPGIAVPRKNGQFPGPHPIKPEVMSARDLGQDSYKDLVVDLVDDEKLTQRIPLAIKWVVDQRRYRVEALLRTPARVAPTTVSADRKLALKLTIASALQEHRVTNFLDGKQFRAYGFGSYVFVDDEYVLSSRAVDGAVDPYWTEYQIQVWKIFTSFGENQTSLGRCENQNGVGTFRGKDTKLVKSEEFLRGFWQEYSPTFLSLSCLEPSFRP